jgi:hypothetical protein
MHQSRLCDFPARDSLAIAAKPVVLGIVDKSCAHGIQVDVCGHNANDASVRLNEHALETLGPECAETVVCFVEPDGEALFEQFHESRDIIHEGKLLFAPGVGVGTASLKLCLDYRQRGGLETGWFRVKQAIATHNLSGILPGCGFPTNQFPMVLRLRRCGHACPLKRAPGHDQPSGPSLAAMPSPRCRAPSTTD